MYSVLCVLCVCVEVPTYSVYVQCLCTVSAAYVAHDYTNLSGFMTRTDTPFFYTKCKVQNTKYILWLFWSSLFGYDSPSTEHAPAILAGSCREPFKPDHLFPHLTLQPFDEYTYLTHSHRRRACWTYIPSNLARNSAFYQKCDIYLISSCS